MKKITIFIIGLIVILIIFATQLQRNRNKEKTKKIFYEEDIPVEVAKVQEIILKDEIESLGEIEPYQKVVIYSEVSGLIEKLNVKEGDYVKKGDFIAQIDYRKRKIEYENVENQLKAAMINLENIKKDYERFTNLFKEGVISEKKLDDIKTQYEVVSHQIEALKKQFEIAKIRLNEAFIYSPINGFIAEKFVDEGEFITESSMMRSVPIVSIIDISKVKINLPVSTEDIGKVKKDQSVLVETDSYHDKVFYGKVSRIYPFVDEKTRTVNVEIILENNSFIIKPGMYCKGKIITGERKSLIVPLDAIMKLPGSGNYYCFRVKDNFAEKVYIKVGKIGESYAEVKEGLNKDDIVIVTSQGILDTGKKIKIIEEKT
ncbi:MAG: efflux RND transporter periplasmic adaptor subunit [Candidatus Omnitrophica bacterium]|nr:efflux RND transporter periplasmic adaptor subunit [Candidatus Omnitrophota bacterium]MCM8802441.1 efflux RND transporter periplasmic adaptor subunit [Candidatus Omnitrophota bacterium]